MATEAGIAICRHWLSNLVRVTKVGRQLDDLVHPSSKHTMFGTACNCLTACLVRQVLGGIGKAVGQGCVLEDVFQIARNNWISVLAASAVLAKIPSLQACHSEAHLNPRVLS